MTYGQLFMILNPNVKVVENGTCVWIYFDSANHDTLRVEWWNKEIHDEALKAQEPDESKYEYHTDHTDCPWYISGEESKCPVTCGQYRDGWNDAMNYIFRNGDGYRPYSHIRKGGEVEWIGKPQSSGLNR